MTHFTMTFCTTCAEKDALIARLSWNESLGMYNQAGGMAAIRALPEGFYTIILADIDRLKAINGATGNHLRTNRYLANGLKVRKGEIAMQFLGDEFVFILAANADANAFEKRVSAQLAAQPLTPSERAALARYGQTTLSATFAACTQVRKADMLIAIEECSVAVLAQKEARG